MKSPRSLLPLLPLLATALPHIAAAQAPSARPPGVRIPPTVLQTAPGVPPPPGVPATPAAPPRTPSPVATPAPPPGAAVPAEMSLGDVAARPDLPKPPSYLVDFTLEDADLAELITTISTITGKRFIFGAKVRNIKVNVYAPKNQKISVAEAYQVFLSILDSNGLTVIPHGKFLKIVESGGIATQTTPIYAAGQPVPPEDRYVTRLYRLSHLGADEVATLLGKFKSKDGDISVYAPGNLLIITDTATNIRRMLELVEEVDVGGAGDQIWVEPIHYGTATDVASRLNEIFDVKAAAAPPGKGPPGAPSAANAESRVSKVVADDRTNSLIIVGTERAYLRMLELVRRLDVPQSGEGQIHVLALQHAMAEELANTLNQILGGAGATGGAPGGPGPRPAQGASPAGGIASGIFEGSIRITADKATNALVVTSSLRDYAQLRNVIDKLDQPRRQVFIEAVIMDLSVDRSTKLGMNYHAGAAPDLGGGSNSLIYGGLNPVNSILLPDPSNLQGLALGVRGPGLDGSTNLLGTGLTVPAFGVVLNALASSGDANVLATPHVIATDNVPAEINVGENIPLQTNLGGGLGALPTGAAGAAGALGGLGGLGALGGLGFGGGFAAPRQDVGTKIKVTPHLNDSNEVRLELIEEISERGASSGALGVVSITKRNAQTTVVVKDQQTVVIGGLMRDSITKSDSKVPLLGDIPVLGFLFRSSTDSLRKTNLLLVLTPYVVRDQNDLRTIFERKMQERQEFLDRYFVFSDMRTYEPPRDWSRTNGLVEQIRQTYLALEERRRLEQETRPKQPKTHEPGQPIEMPGPAHSGAAAPAGSPAPGTPGGPAFGTRDAGRGEPPTSSPPPSANPPPQSPGGAPPVILSPPARNLNIERSE